VDALYDEIFLDAFISRDDSLIDKSHYCRAVNDKLADDQQLKSLLIKQFERVDKNDNKAISETQVKAVLHKILRKQIRQMRDGDDSDDDILIGGEKHFLEGSYAKDTI